MHPPSLQPALLRSVFIALCAAVASPVDAIEASPPKLPMPEGITFHEAATRVLVTSDKPRDWVLAAQLSVGRTAPEEDQSTQGLLQRAAAAAANDAMVQWIWTNNNIVAANPNEDRAAALRKLEPDNASVWTFELAQAAKRKDESGIDAAIKHMAAATRDDVHWVDTALAWNEALQRTLANADARAAIKRMNATTPAETLVTEMAIALGAAFTKPPYQALTRACEVNAKPAPSEARKADCVTVGRLLLSKGSTIINQRVGAAILRKAGQFGEEDQRALREVDWIMAQYNIMMAGKAEKPAKADDQANEIKEWALDHKVGDREVDSWKRRLERHGLAQTPPADWVSPRQSREAAKATKAEAASEKQ